MSARKENIDIDYLYEEYVIKKKSAKQISEQLSLPWQLIRTRLHANGIVKIVEDNYLYTKPYKLLVIEKIESDKSRADYWCQCDCGELIIINATCLTRRKSCGCANKKIGTGNSRYTGCGDISGKKFGKIKACSDSKKREFTITVEYIWELFLQQNRKCIYTGMDLFFSHLDIKGATNASLDRIDSSKGYIFGNVQWVHVDVNFIKSKFSEEYFLKMVDMIYNYRIKTELYLAI